MCHHSPLPRRRCRAQVDTRVPFLTLRHNHMPATRNGYLRMVDIQNTNTECRLTGCIALPIAIQPRRCRPYRPRIAGSSPAGRMVAMAARHALRGIAPAARERRACKRRHTSLGCTCLPPCAMRTASKRDDCRMPVPRRLAVHRHVLGDHTAQAALKSPNIDGVCIPCWSRIQGRSHCRVCYPMS